MHISSLVDLFSPLASVIFMINAILIVWSTGDMTAFMDLNYDVLLESELFSCPLSGPQIPAQLYRKPGAASKSDSCSPVEILESPLMCLLELIIGHIRAHWQTMDNSQKEYQFATKFSELILWFHRLSK